MNDKIEHHLHDEIIAGANFGDTAKTTIIFGLYERGLPTRPALARAVLAWRRIKITPTTVITILVSGYDDDPRELWQIPEVCHFVRKFCAKTDALKSPALDPMSRGVLLACGGDPEVTPVVRMCTIEESMRDHEAWLKDRLT